MADKIHKMGDDGKGNTLYAFHCPGCGHGHHAAVPRWSWNGSYDKPTFTPSLLVNKDDPSTACHSFVEDGKIRFLNDSYHNLKGQIVEIPDWDT